MSDKLETSWFTFGQCHIHDIEEGYFDKDVVVKITAKDPRAEMFRLFGPKWSMQYNDEPDLSLYPSGVITL